MYRALEPGGKNMGLSVSRITLQSDRRGDCGTGGIGVGVGVTFGPTLRHTAADQNGIQEESTSENFGRLEPRDSVALT